MTISAQSQAFGVLNWLVVVAYVAVTLGIGFYFSRRQRTTDEYFTAGRNRKPFLVGISLFTALFSVISYLSNPGEYIQNGPVLGCIRIASLPLTYVVVGWLLIPIIMRLPITSAYELLEGRLGKSVRLTGSLIFILTRLIWMSLILYAVSAVLVNVIGLDRRWAPVFGIVAGSVTLIYTLSGGIDAVMVTDVVQFFVLLLGAVLTIGSISFRLGGIAAWWPRHWESHWAAEPFFSLDPHVRVTVIGTILSYIVAQACVAGSDQIAIQRYLTTRDAATARRAYLLNSVAGACAITILLCTGAALLQFYRLHPSGLPATTTSAKAGDAFFPHYIGHNLPVGISGLVVSGVLAAAMSGLSSGINSTVTVISKDFIETFRLRVHRRERVNVRTARFLALGVGATAIIGSLGIGAVRGNLAEVTGKTDNILVCPLFGLFFLALFVRFATPFGAVLGAIYSLVGAVLIGYWDLLTGLPKLSFQWIGPVSLAVSLGSGCFFSLLPTRGRPWTVIGVYGFAALAPLGALVSWLVLSHRITGH